MYQPKIFRVLCFLGLFVLFGSASSLSALGPQNHRSAARIQQEIDDIDLESQELENEFNKVINADLAELPPQRPPPPQVGEMAVGGINLLGEKSELPLLPNGSSNP